jgi:hypothetical protein
MTHTITIETQNDHDFALLKELVQRLGFSVKDVTNDHTPDEADQQAALQKFVGSWQGSETAEELESLIYKSRNDHPRDIDL